MEYLPHLKSLWKKFPSFASNLIGLNDQDVRTYVSGLAEFCMSNYFQFDCTKGIEKEMVCTGLDERIKTNLLEVQNGEWQQIGYKEQFNNLRN